MDNTITVEVIISAPVDRIWSAYTTPSEIMQWNAASDDWHTTSCTVDLREGGKFCMRMEAKDGSSGFDFEGTYTKVVPYELLEFTFGDRKASVQFTQEGDDVAVIVVFDAESESTIVQEQQEWQAILKNFAQYVEAGQ